MIGFNRLGTLGNLGNQMFQYAALQGIAAHRKFDFCIPPLNDGGENILPITRAFLLTNLHYTRLIKGLDIRESHFHFDGDLFNSVPDECSIKGYFQSERYFKHIEDKIRSDFQFKPFFYKQAQSELGSLDQPIALHVRRGDYLLEKNSRVFPLCTQSYYKKALEKFEKNRMVIVFSDSPNLCKKWFTGGRFIIREGNSGIADLCLMTLCSDFIIANSSFSWWGSYLSKNKNKKIIAPKQWFMNDSKLVHNTKDLYLKQWYLIDNMQ